MRHWVEDEEVNANDFNDLEDRIVAAENDLENSAERIVNRTSLLSSSNTDDEYPTIEAIKQFIGGGSEGGGGDSDITILPLSLYLQEEDYQFRSYGLPYIHIEAPSGVAYNLIDIDIRDLYSLVGYTHYYIHDSDMTIFLYELVVNCTIPAEIRLFDNRPSLAPEPLNLSSQVIDHIGTIDAPEGYVGFSTPIQVAPPIESRVYSIQSNGMVTLTSLPYFQTTGIFPEYLSIEVPVGFQIDDSMSQTVYTASVGYLFTEDLARNGSLPRTIDFWNIDNESGLSLYGKTFHDFLAEILMYRYLDQPEFVTLGDNPERSYSLNRIYFRFGYGWLQISEDLYNYCNSKNWWED